MSAGVTGLSLGFSRGAFGVSWESAGDVGGGFSSREGGATAGCVSSLGDTKATERLLTRSLLSGLSVLVVPVTIADSLVSAGTSALTSGFSCPAAPGRGGKLDRPNSKLGEGERSGAGGGDCVPARVNFSSLLFLLPYTFFLPRVALRDVLAPLGSMRPLPICSRRG